MSELKDSSTQDKYTFGKIWIASILGTLSLWTVQSLIGLYAAQHFSLTYGLYLIAIATIPNVIAIPFIGAIVDRYNPQMVSTFALILQTFFLVIMGYCSYHDYAMWVVIISGLSALAGSFWTPARQRLLNSVIEKKQRAKANSQLGSITGIMTVIGASCGAILSLLPTWSLIIAAGLRIVMIFLVRGISLPKGNSYDKTALEKQNEMPSFWQRWKSGFSVAKHSTLSWSIICLGIAWGLIGGIYERLLAYFIVLDLHGGEKIRFFYYIIDGLAVIIGSFIASRLPQRRHIPLYALSYVVQGLFWSGTFMTAHLSISLLSLLLMRIASGVIIGLDTTILLATIADEYHGRVMTVHSSTYTLVGRCSLVLVAFLASFLSLRFIGISLGIASFILGILWWFLSGKKSLQHYINAIAG